MANDNVSAPAAKASARALKHAPARSGAATSAGARGVQVGERAVPSEPPSAPRRQLDVFANPAPERDYLIEFQIPEFTCHCPLTGQPDFAHFTIEMIADRLCVELKSLKLYMWSYRSEGAFHEKVTNTVADDIVAATSPRFLRITAKWFVRGGIYTNVVVEHRQEGWQPPLRVELPSSGRTGVPIA